MEETKEDCIYSNIKQTMPSEGRVEKKPQCSWIGGAQKHPDNNKKSISVSDSGVAPREYAAEEGMCCAYPFCLDPQHEMSGHGQ